MGNKSNYKYSFSQLRKDVVLDIEAYLGFASEYNSNERNWRSNLSALLMPSVIACWIYRYSHWFYSHGFSRISLIISGLNQFLLGVSITPASRIQGGLYIAHPASGIVFQGDAGMRLKLLAGSAVTAEPMMPLHRHGHSKSPHFGDNVALGSKAFVCGSVTVGSNTRIGFNAVIFEDIPENSLVISTYVRNRIEKNNV
jgi:serine O-acetyltransferase